MIVVLRVSEVRRTSMLFFFLMIRRPPRSTLDRSSAASDVYKRQLPTSEPEHYPEDNERTSVMPVAAAVERKPVHAWSVSYTHLRAHETVLDLVCRLLLEKKTDVRHYHPVTYLSNHTL